MTDEPVNATLTRIDLPFWHLVWFLVRLSFASSIAFLLTCAIWFALLVAVGTAGKAVLNVWTAPLDPALNAEPSSEPAPIAETLPPTPTGAEVPQPSPVAPRKLSAQSDPPDDWYAVNPDPARVITAFGASTDQVRAVMTQPAPSPASTTAATTVPATPAPVANPEPAAPVAANPSDLDKARARGAAVMAEAAAKHIALEARCERMILKVYPDESSAKERAATAGEVSDCLTLGHQVPPPITVPFPQP